MSAPFYPAKTCSCGQDSGSWTPVSKYPAKLRSPAPIHQKPPCREGKGACLHTFRPAFAEGGGWRASSHMPSFSQAPESGALPYNSWV